MRKAVLFDLDDTLYDERDFVTGGFEAVAQVLALRGIGPTDEAVRRLERFHHQEGRAGVFQKLAESMRFPDEWIPELVKTFREHAPRIRMFVIQLENQPLFLFGFFIHAHQSIAAFQLFAL